MLGFPTARRGAALVAVVGLLVGACSSSGDDADELGGEASVDGTPPTAAPGLETGADDEAESAPAATDVEPADPSETSAAREDDAGDGTDGEGTDADGDDDTAPDLQTAAAAYDPPLTDRPCPGEPPAGTTCHWIEVPSDWGEPDADTIRLPVTVLSSAASTPRLDPVVVPAGGPGFDAARNYGWSGSPFAAERDIVLYDQRGTGLAEPSLDCPEVDGAFVENLQRDAPFDDEAAVIIDATLACRDRLATAGVDFDDYDSVASALDLDAIRRALGVDEWNILGISYGARLALTAMRTTPVGVRSVILDSVYDVTYGGTASTVASAERAFGVLDAACEADTACADAFDVTALIDETVARFDAEPAVVEADVGNGPETFVITGGDALAGLFNAMYDPGLIPILPSLLADLAEGDVSVVPELIRAGVRQGTGEAEAMQLSVDCADNAGLEVDAADEALLADPGLQRLLAIAVPCSTWNVEPTSPGYNDPIIAETPALVLAGTFDPITPPGDTEAVAERLPNSTFALFPDGAHGVVGPNSPCAESLALAFLDDPAAPVDTSCVADQQTAPFAS